MRYLPLKHIYNFNKTLYFLSEKNFNNVELKPRVPRTLLLGYEDPKTKRICCSDSISGAYRALETIGNYKILYVHTINNVLEISNNGNLIKPTKDRVDDVDRTNEFWITCPVTLSCIGKVSIGYDAFALKYGTPEGEHVHFKYIEKYNTNNMNENFLNEETKIERLSQCDHSRVLIVQIKPLQNELIKKGYSCLLLSKSARESKNANYDMILKRSSFEKSYVKIYRRRRSTGSLNILLSIGKFSDKNTIFDDILINEICIICPPQINSDPEGLIVDNTKACFFDKEVLLQAYIDGKLQAKTTREGDSIVIPERWAKENAKEVVSYKYSKCICESNNIEKVNFNALLEKLQISKWIEDHFKIITTKNSLDKTIEMKWFVPKEHSGDSRFYADDGKPSALMKFFRDHEITKFIGNSLGFSEKEQKWYGWSHRAIHGFGIGDEAVELYPGITKKGKKCKTLADCKKAAKAFAKSVD